MSRRKKRLVVVAAALVGIAGLGYVSYVGFRQPVGSSPAPAAASAAAPRPGGVVEPRPGGAAAPGGQPPVRVETARVAAAELAVEASAVGSLRSNESVVLRPEIAGRIASIHFRDGVAVGKGALLVALDSATQAAELDQAKANLGLAQANHQRSEDLFARKFISRQALDNAQAALKVQEAALSLAQAKFDKTRLRAPFAGIVGLRQVSVGDYVKEGQELVNIEDIGTLKIDFRLPESYLPQLRPGQRLEVSSDALPGQVFTALLEAINPLVEAGGRAISLRAVLPNDEARLRPGMFVRVRLLFGQREKALLIPEEAVVPDSAAPYVYRVVDGVARRTTIRTGLRRGAAVEVVEGLSAGDEIVTAGQLKLREGSPVRPLAAPAAEPPAHSAAGPPAGQAAGPGR